MKKSLMGYLLWAVFLGTLFLSPGMVGLALIPLSVLAVGTLVDPPRGITLSRRVSRSEVRLGEEIEVRVRLRVERGVGIVLVRDVLPKSFELTGGSNVGVFFKGLKPLEVEYSYRIKPALRGFHTLPRSEVATRNPLGTRHHWGLYGRELRVRAVPEVLKAVPVRETRRKSKISVPETSYAMRGPLSTDFKEIRDYRPGDPMKLINWKATARTGDVLVNEFEREGRKTVIFIVDTRAGMKAGASGESPYERAMKLVASMAQIFLRRDYHVGLYLLGARAFLPPATGPGQLHEIVRKMMEFERISGEEGLDEAVERLRGALIRYTPLVIYVSNVLEENAVETRKGLGTVLALGKARIKPVLVDVSPRINGENAEVLVELEKRAILKDLAAVAHVARWMPGEDLGKPLSRLAGEVE